MDLVVLEPKFAAWFKQHNYHIEKTHVRPWGGFQVCIKEGAHGRTLHFNEPFGSAFTTLFAGTKLIVQEIKKHPIPQVFYDYFGSVRIHELIELCREEIDLLPKN